MMVVATAVGFVAIVALAVWAVRAARAGRRWAVAAAAPAAAAIVLALGRWGTNLDGFDSLTWLAFLCSMAATVAGWMEMRRGRHCAAVVLLVLAAFMLRADLAGHFWLTKWDEAYHATVARHLMVHPLKPTLVEYPLAPMAPEHWRYTDVWMHKPPLTMWLMAASMKAFGVNEIAMRLPSVIVSTLEVLVTWLLVRRLCGVWAAFYAAAFNAWHGRSLQLAAGLRATDHVDNMFVALVAAGILLVVLAGDALTERRRGGWLLTVAAGLALGLALLAKGGPALVVPGVFFLHLVVRRASWPKCVVAPCLVAAVGVVMCLPWYLYAARHYPEDLAYYSSIMPRYFREPAEDHAEAWYWHLQNTASYYGYLIYIPLIAFFVQAVRRRREWLPMVALFVVVYGIFSVSATKMKCYVFIAAPAIWCALGWCVAGCLHGQRKRAARPRAALLLLGLAVCGAYFHTAALRGLRLSSPYPRRTMFGEEMRYLAGQVEELLPKGNRVVFNVTPQVRAMFYVDATCMKRAPSEAALRQARAGNFSVAVYGSRDDPALAAAAQQPDVTFIPLDPRTAPARELAELLSGLSADQKKVVVFNARRAADLEQYLYPELTGHADVVRKLPRKGSNWLKRRLRAGKPMVVLVGDDEERVAETRREFPDFIYLKAPALAR